jgi:glycosyltransferase involved in cell wall biosynthesis
MPTAALERNKVSQTAYNISVIICAYTEDRWNDLVAAVESVRQQTLPPREIIIVIDHNPGLLKRVQEHLPDVVAVENTETRGLRSARNSGIGVAQSQIIAFLDDDAVATPDMFIGAVRYEQSDQRRDYRNGHYARSLDTSLGHIDDLPVPRTRGRYQTHLFERYHRRRTDLGQTIGEMFIGGVSMTRVGEVVETLTGTKPSASTVSRVFHTLESEYEQWKTRKLAERYVYAFADGTYFTVIMARGAKCPFWPW